MVIEWVEDGRAFIHLFGEYREPLRRDRLAQ